MSNLCGKPGDSSKGERTVSIAVPSRSSASCGSSGSTAAGWNGEASGPGQGATAQGSAVRGGQRRPGRVDGLQTAQPRGASRARGSPAGRPGQCEGRAAQGQAGSPGAWLRPDTRHSSLRPQHAVRRPQLVPAVAPAPHGFTPLPPFTSGQTPLSAQPWAHPSLQRLPNLPEPLLPRGEAGCDPFSGACGASSPAACWRPLGALSAGSCGRRGWVAFPSCASHSTVSQVMFSHFSQRTGCFTVPPRQGHSLFIKFSPL